MYKKIVLVILFCLIAIGYAFSIPQYVSNLVKGAPIGTGLVAKQLCTGIFVQGRTETDIREDELGPKMDPRLRFITAEIDHQKKEVRTNMFGFFESHAGLRSDGDGGCSVLYEGEGVDKSFDLNPDPRPWPLGDAVHPEAKSIVPDYDALEKAAEAEFLPTEEGYDRGTRSLLVVHKGKLVYERHAEGWNSTIPQMSRSMAKTVSSALTGILVGEGKLSLDTDSLRPEWTDSRANIKLRNILQMESGLEYNEIYNQFGDPAKATFLHESASDFAAEKPLLHQPGAKISYSSGDSDLLMAIARTFSGRTDREWANFPREKLFGPIGMNRTVFERDAGGDYVGSVFMFAAAVDWARLGLLFARKGKWGDRQVLPEGWVDYMATPTDLSCNYGAMMYVRGADEERNPGPVIEMLGSWGQSVVIVPETETVIVRTAWGFHRQEEMLNRFFTALDLQLPITYSEKRNGVCIPD
jgi:hypothetical protein